MSELLDQSEIDRLLAEKRLPGRNTIILNDGRRHPNPRSVVVEAFDFRTPVFLAENELRRLRLLHQEYISTLSIRFSDLLRCEVNLKMSKLAATSFTRFADSVKNPSHLTLFKVDPLPGIAVLEIPPRLALTITNRMLGGRGGTDEVDRHLTEIEIALLEEAVDAVLTEWCQQWRDGVKLTAKRIGHETNARFLQIFSGDAVLLVLGMDTILGDSVEQMQIAVPNDMLEPIMRSMQIARREEIKPSEDDKPAQWRPTFSHISVPLKAEWDIGPVEVQDLLHLREGDVLELPRTILSKTKVHVANTPRFVGMTGSENGHVAVEIHTVEPPGDIES